MSKQKFPFIEQFESWISYSSFMEDRSTSLCVLRFGSHNKASSPWEGMKIKVTCYTIEIALLHKHRRHHSVINKYRARYLILRFNNKLWCLTFISEHVSGGPVSALDSPSDHLRTAWYVLHSKMANTFSRWQNTHWLSDFKHFLFIPACQETSYYRSLLNQLVSGFASICKVHGIESLKDTVYPIVLGHSV